jgi:signal transduction histidine kinase
MSSSLHPTPAQEAAALLADVQKQVLRGMVWTLIAFAGLQLILWHRIPVAQRPAISLAFEAILVVGLSLQFFGMRRWSVAGNGLLFVSWLGLIDVLVWINAGPQMSTAIALVCTVLVALFFINKRAGAAVVLAFGLLIVVHAWLVSRGQLAPYPGIAGWPPLNARRLLWGGLTSFAVLAVCYTCFAMIHHALFRTLARVAEERRNRDLAEAARRQAEDTMRANQHFEALGKLSSGVAHDVNNALTAILCHADLLRLTLPPGEEQASANAILTAGHSAARTTRQLLSLSRHSFCQPVSLDPAPELKNVNRLAAHLLPERLWISAEGGGRRRILVDPADLQQALLNLLLNARDAMPEGGAITLLHEDVTLPDGAPGVALRVRDSGTGIAPGVRGRIFDPFFTTKAVGQGTGLGLAMVKAFVEEAGGTIDLQSEVGRGTTVSLLFPECLAAPPSPGAVTPPQPAAGRRLLLIEDRDDLRQLMERVLRRGGYEVTACASSDEALIELDGGGQYELLCTDGIGSRDPVTTVITRFRAQQPALPVLLCSGHVDSELIDGGLASLQVELLRKPFTGAELLARLGALSKKTAPGAGE